MKIAAGALLLATCFGAPAAAVCDPDLGCGTGRLPPPPATPVATLSVQAQAAQLGLHSVTQVWAADVVATEGAVTTYSTNVDRQAPGTYARRVASVGTGEGTAYDNVVFNGRTSLSNGQRVAGDVYASYVVRGGGLVLDRYVFFQDDSEVARLGRSGATAAAPVGAVPAAPAPLPAAVPASLPAAVSRPPVSTALPAPARPGAEPRPRRGLPPRDVQAGIALEPQGDVLSRIEVLRGRAVRLWARGSVDGAPARVSAWRVVSGELTALGPVSGSGDQPLVATWRAITRPGSAFTLQMAVDIVTPGQGTTTVAASIEIVVRSPALIE